jgi:ATP-dependent exoDNAse (exonuclease V) alpha subunit
LAGDRQLVVVEGAAGAGKTTTLAATKQLLDQQGRGFVVVTSTLKAAKVAQAEVGAHAGSAAWLAFQHGWRWNDDGAWTRLQVGQIDSATGRVHAGPTTGAQLRPGDLLVVDEAGMLDQDTARGPCSPSPTTAGCGWRYWVTGTSWPRSVAAASWTWPRVWSTRRRA